MDTRYTDIKGLCKYAGCGMSQARKIGVLSGAAIRLGTRFTRYDLQVIDEYLQTEGRKKQNGEEVSR